MSFVWSKTFWMNFPVKSRYGCSHNNLIIVEIKCCGAPTTWWDKWISGMYVQMLLMCWGWVGWIPEAALSEPTQHNTLLSPQWSSQHWLYSTGLYLLVMSSFIFLIDAVSRDKIFMIQLSVQQSHWSTLSDVEWQLHFIPYSQTEMDHQDWLRLEVSQNLRNPLKVQPDIKHSTSRLVWQDEQCRSFCNAASWVPGQR